jgi:hypothetical protein
MVVAVTSVGLSVREKRSPRTGVAMKRSRSRMVGGLAGVLFAFAIAGTVSAYWTQTPHTVSIHGPRHPKCGEWVEFRATIRDHEGDRIPNGGPVIWSFTKSPSSSDQINPTQSNTNSRGVAVTMVKFACVPGERILRAQALNASGQISVRPKIKDDDEEDDDDGDDRHGGDTIQALTAGSGTGSNSANESVQTASLAKAARATGELPRTSTTPSNSPTLVALLALVIGAGLLLRPHALQRR